MCRSRRYLAESVGRAPADDLVPAPSRADRTIRASDRDREAVIALLGEHTGAGRLTLTEFEERVSEATSARTLADLDRLLVDLPVVPSPRPAAASGRGRAERWRPWLMTAAICLTIWSATSIMAGYMIYFWPFWVIAPWGILLAVGSSSRRRLVR